LPNPREFLEQKAKSRGGAHVASFRREYLGEWIRDESSLVFRLKPAINVIDYYDFGQATDWLHVLGVDLGFNDPSAFVVIAYSQDLNTAVVMESFEKTELTASKVAAIVEDLDQSYGFANMRGDSQGYGKSIVEGLKEDYGIPMQAAKKRDKPARIEMINSDLRNGVIKILRRQNIDLIEQMGLLQWDEEALESNKYQFADTRFADHLADAFVYAYWDCHPNTDNWVKDPPRRDSPQWFKELEEKWIQAKEEEVFRKPDEMDWFG
jgi:hypothetical protein